MDTIKLEYHQIIDENAVRKELEFQEDLLKLPYSRKSLFVSTVEGESMQPLIKDRSLVIADLSQKEFEDGAIFLIEKDQNMWIKKASYIEKKEFFVSINPDYSHLVYKREDCRILAKVLLHFDEY
ncbi:S24 family peptidase [Sulfurovum sp. XGS-02]|uniref:S24 family peptidase n=1 Tax=Sulfurovum sp. XGS-02 TaxID=2925411 RepID=UPI002060A4F9|nr:S24 family peptidase [Sulfurovum sp. XGS-02]UPT78443.1 S24 family peptidase [Sulfurovum sp. XGS-02]